MGRPLSKDQLGVNAIGATDSASPYNTGIRVEFYDTQLRTDGIILKQRGAKTFVVSREGTVGTAGDAATESLRLSTGRATCVLKNGAPSAANEMRLFGYAGSNDGSEVNIAKITKRVATDFSGNRYTWALENDSTNDYIVLTAI
jgi:hypothetical protein